MEDGEVPDHCFTYDGRLTSFQFAQPVLRRKSNAKGRAPKALAWPHKQLDPNTLARAGFYFEPTQEQPDNTVCFLCQKRIGGWEHGDDPIEEHLRLSPHCGWAIVAAIESGLGDYSMDDPSHPDMMEARKATFAGRWPHEGKRGWKCKTKQLVDAGWKYTPTLDSDDMATCTYCQLALDGWEPADKPMNEHYKRSPDCPFFTLIDQYQQGPAKKTARGKGARASKASRLSSQSVATLASEAPSVMDQTADHEDSVMTTTSVMTAGGTKRGRAKKGTTAKGKKTRGKKDEPVEVLEDRSDEDLPPPPPPKPTRGRKRASDSVEDSVLTNAEAPAPKKRAARGRPSKESKEVDVSVVEPHRDLDMVDAFPAPPVKTKGKNGRGSKAASIRKASAASTASIASLRHAEEDMPDDEALDRQLQADLDRPLSDDDMIAADSDSERKKAPAKGKVQKEGKEYVTATQTQLSGDHAMFDPASAEVDDADMSAELQQLRERMKAEEAETLQPPKKGRKAGTRKASKQTKSSRASRTKQPAPEPESEPEAQAGPATVMKGAPAPAEIFEPDELSFASDATVHKNSTTAAPAPKKRGRPKKNSTQPPPQPMAEDKQPEFAPEPAPIETVDTTQKSSTPDMTALKALPKQKSLAPPPAPEEEPEGLQVPATPTAIISPAPAAKKSAISPSQSPQSSDAENQPPSSKPSNTAVSDRVALGPMTATPMRASPSKRNVNFLHGLQSDQPWTAVELDVVFENLLSGKENAAPGALNGVQLSSPERTMTVEQWIHHNASLAEERLRGECEAMVTTFEGEGGRAMQCLEGLVVES
ncbi:inhibitor of apoptosis domain-containing protein [Xylariales sp. AK1849]|nr:inhibitor of apoptosis domain-containing protein [Xylariales sp. AK1849]